MINHAAGGKWGAATRRILESGARMVPWGLVLMIPIFIGMKALYPWMDHQLVESNHILHHRHSYLNLPFIFIRLAICFALWTALVNRFTRGSWWPGPSANFPVTSRFDGVACAGLVFTVFTGTFWSFDWLMSLEPLWSSTIYGAMTLIGGCLTAMAFTILIRMVQEATEDIYIETQVRHDLGNLMFGFLLLWAYMMLSQFLIIYSASLPEEIPWYMARSTGGWNKVVIYNLIFHFVVPFIILLQQRVKQNTYPLAVMAAYMLAIRACDILWIIYPAFSPGKLHLDWALIPTFLGIGGFWIWGFSGKLKKAML
jgi:hypothetical protein